MATICLVTPALPQANDGNAHTAARWLRFAAPLAQVRCVKTWDGEPADALIALHALRSAESIAGFRRAHEAAPIALVLTGTDLYRDWAAGNAGVAHSFECATHIVALQRRALHVLPVGARGKARVIEQSATRLRRNDQSRSSFDFVAVGHLRAEKDPLTLMRAARRLSGEPGLRILHVGGVLDSTLGEEARRTAQECSHYRWLGALPAAAARRWIARARAFVHPSRMEGGANVVIEAVRSGVPVLASGIDGNLGLLGDDYAGCFDAGDDAALAALMRRFMHDAAFARRLAEQCAACERRFAPSVEAAAVRALVQDMLGASTIGA